MTLKRTLKDLKAYVYRHGKPETEQKPSERINKTFLELVSSSEELKSTHFLTTLQWKALLKYLDEEYVRNQPKTKRKSP